jgi:2-succinyl-5-enolpyruvyl-6-hydroxy-3-cyclohexene-1-carboxylate synthase
MKIKINRNILWAETFINHLVKSGVKYACVSPGSRSTPLAYTFATCRDIKSFIHVDERSSAFFATGLARKSGIPVVLACTSGTAVAEFYPAIIEAYQQRIPLIVCTADRPSGSHLRGVNQTINQNNIFKNHIRWFIDAGLPDPKNLKSIAEISLTAFNRSMELKGPVHINFPFDKPFEPDSFTDSIEEYSLSFHSPVEITSQENYPAQELIEKIGDTIVNVSEGIITVGPSDFSETLCSSVLSLSNITGYPVFADGASQIRFGNSDKNIFTNYDALFRTDYFQKNKPSVIIHFGRTMTSKGYEDFIINYNGYKYIINKWGDIFDPVNKFNALIKSDEESFISKLTGYLQARRFIRNNSTWMNKLQQAENVICRVKQESVYTAGFPDEGRIISEVINALPENTNLMMSNSTPVRDLDYFAEQLPQKIKVYHNRGASGIDGIISTAAGIAAEGGSTILITGDLAFYHDMNGLLACRQYQIPLLIILINNNGGGIFNALPVSRYEEVFNEYFITPTDLNFKLFTEAYGGTYKDVNSWEELKASVVNALGSNKFSVLEIKTNASESLRNRNNFWKIAGEKIK